LLTTDTETKAAHLRQASTKYDRGDVIVRVVPNRGRDVGPMLTVLDDKILQRYDIIGHLHGKRSPLIEGQIGDQWREFLWQNLIGGLHPMMDIIVDRFVAEPDLGLVFPSDPTLCGWDTNRDLAAKIATRCGIAEPLPAQIDFPVGMMFWSRVDALRPLIALRLQCEDFPEEPVAYDGTILHALERLLPFVARQAGYRYSVTHVPDTTR
jgi:lipopolysaccharide biosynthesis protein